MLGEARDIPPAVLDPARLESVRATGLLDVVAVESLDHLTRLASTLLEAPLAFLTVVDEDRSYWASCTGVEDGTRQNTVEESFCQYVIADAAPVVIEDAAAHPRTRANPSVAGMGVRAWAGYPLLDTEGRPLGSFCVVDTVPRAWSAKQVEVLGVLAGAASAHVAVLSQARAQQAARETAANLRAVSEGLSRMAVVSLELGAVTTLEGLARVVVEHGLPALGATGGVIGVRDDDALVLRLVRGTSPIPEGYETLPLDHALPMPRAALTGESSVMSPVDVDPAVLTRPPQVRERAGAGTWACGPMRGLGGRLMGAVSASWAPGVAVTEREVGLLQVFTALCAQTLERLELQAEQRRSTLALRAMSETLQRSLLTQPSVPEHLTVALRYVPAASEAQIGGDWYDAFVTARGRLTLAIGDISGHDQNAAAAMGQVRNLLRGMAFDSDDGPAALLGRLDTALLGLELDTLATALVVRVEQDEADRARGVHRLIWSSAGHLPALVRCPDGTVDVLDEPPDLMLGVDASASRTERVLELQDGTSVLMYTDGLVERRSVPLDESIDDLRLRFEQVGDVRPEELCDALLVGVRDDERRDDLAMLVVRFDRS